MTLAGASFILDPISFLAPKRTDEPGGIRLYRLLYDGKRRLEDFQLLCANCHAINTFEGRESRRAARKAERRQRMLGS